MTLYKAGIFIQHGFQLAASYKLEFASRYVAMIAGVALFYFIDVLLQGSGTNQVENSSYFAFALVGGAFLRYLTAGMRAFALTLREEMLMGTLEPILVTATPTTVSLIGPSFWALIEGTVLMFMQLFIGWLLGVDYSQANWVSTFVVLLVSIGTITCFGILAASFTIIFKRGDPVSWAVNSVAYVLSGVYFPITVLPSGLRFFAYLLPPTYTLRALRGALLQGQSVTQLLPDILALLGFTAVLLPLSIVAMRYAVSYLKQTGNLTHY